MLSVLKYPISSLKWLLHNERGGPADQSDDADLGDEDNSQSSDDLGDKDESTEGDQSSSKDTKDEDQDFSFIPEDTKPEVKALLMERDKEMKSAFNKKMTEFDQQNKGKKVINKYDDLLTDPEFTNWAQSQMQNAGYFQAGSVTQMSMDDAINAWSRMSDPQRTAYFTNLKPDQRELFKTRLQLNWMYTTNYKEKEDAARLKAEEEHGELFGKKSAAIQQMRTQIPQLSHDQAFRVLDYKEYGKRMFEAGKLEGEKNVKNKGAGSIKSGSGTVKGATGGKKAKSVREAYEQAEEEVSATS